MKIKYHFIRLLYGVFRLILPIDNKLIIFASERDYTDNSWALYQYIHSNFSQYKFVWATLQDKKYNNDERTLFVHHPYTFTIRSAWYIAQAKYLFYTHGLGANLVIRKEQKVINLWHGIAIKGKKGGIVNKDKTKPLFTDLIYLGEMNKSTQAQFLDCDEKYLVPLGYPRIDLMLNEKSEGYTNPFVPERFNGKVVIWMPTFRKSISKSLSEDSCETETGLPLLGTVTEINQLNEYLKTINVCIIAKIHHLQAENKVYASKYSNLIFVTDDKLFEKGIQLYQMIGKTDALLSDYSSIAIDYLLLNRPMGFIIDDIDEYEKSRGKFLYDDIKSVLAGSHIYEIQQLYQFLDEISHGMDSTADLRNKIIDSMITYQDNKSCERICDYCNIK